MRELHRGFRALDDSLVWKRLGLMNAENKYAVIAECGIVQLGWGIIVLRY